MLSLNKIKQNAVPLYDGTKLIPQDKPDLNGDIETANRGITPAFGSNYAVLASRERES